METTDQSLRLEQRPLFKEMSPHIPHSAHFPGARTSSTARSPLPQEKAGVPPLSCVWGFLLGASWSCGAAQEPSQTLQLRWTPGEA